MIMSKAIFFFMVIITISTSLGAQMTLPKIQKADTSGVSIEGTYVPRDAFKKLNPNFLNDGRYFFNYNSLGLNQFNLDWEGFFGYYNFDFRKFPAVETQTNFDLSELGRILVQFNTDPATISSFRLATKGKSGGVEEQRYVYSHFGIENPELYNLKKEDLQYYENINTNYKSQVASLLEKKHSKNKLIYDLGTLKLDDHDSALFYNDLIFQFVFVQNNTWMSGSTADKFPSHSLFKLVVKNIFGDSLRSYGQAVFFEGKNSKWSRPQHTESFVIRKTFPIAFENLINQFLNDRILIAEITKFNNVLAAKINNDKRFDSLINLRIKFQQIQSKKEQLKLDLNTIGYDFSMTSAKIQGSKEGSEGFNMLNPINAAAGFTTDIFFKGAEKREMRKNDDKLAVMKQEMISVSMEEQTFIDSIKFLNLSPIEFQILSNLQVKNNSELNAQLNEVGTIKDKTHTELESVYSMLNSQSIQSLNNYINKNKSGISLAETAGGSNNASGNSNNTECMNQAQAEWYNSVEYKNYQNNSTNANASYCKAKIAELTVKYCSGNLSPSDIQNIQNSAKNLRAQGDFLLKNSTQIKN